MIKFTDEQIQKTRYLLKDSGLTEEEKEIFLLLIFEPKKFFERVKTIIDGIPKEKFEKNEDSDILSTEFGIVLALGYYMSPFLKKIENVLNYTRKETDIISSQCITTYSSYIDELAQKKLYEIFGITDKSNIVVSPISNGKYMPMSYNKAAVAMTIMDSKGLTPNILGTMTITAKDVEMQIANFTGISATFNISTSKLLTAGIIRFTQQNNIGDLRKTESEILIPVKEYAALCGYDVEERPTNTPEEQQKEKNRVKNLLKYVRKEIDKDLELLYNASVSFKTNSSDYTDIRIITKKGIANKGKYIQMKFEEDFAKSLKTCRLTMFPINLFKVKNPTAYRIGIAMSNHYNNDNNLISKTADRMKIKTLLEYSGLPTIEEVRKSRKSWRERIQEPFEKALETLHSEKILDNYEYVRTGNAEISDLDIDLEYYKVDSDYQFTDFETWTGLLVKFKLHEAIDHTERIEQKLNEKESSKSSKKKVSRQKRETNNTETIEPKRKRGRPKKSE